MHVISQNFFKLNSFTRYELVYRRKVRPQSVELAWTGKFEMERDQMDSTFYFLLSDDNQPIWFSIMLNEWSVLKVNIEALKSIDTIGACETVFGS